MELPNLKNVLEVSTKNLQERKIDPLATAKLQNKMLKTLLKKCTFLRNDINAIFVAYSIQLKFKGSLKSAIL